MSILSYFKRLQTMPGEIGDETESQQVGYKGHAYPPTGEFMDDERSIHKEKENQKDKIKRRVMQKFFEKHELEHSILPDGGPSQGSTSNPL
jgi:uncharacterized protein Yka (UPF0111/DUF47 family)